VIEGIGSYNVCLSINPVCDRRATVNLVTEQKDALGKLLNLLVQLISFNHLAGVDYDAVVVTVSFDANERVSCSVINNIIDDNIRETDQCFLLKIVPGPDSDLVPGGNANVTIVDDDIILASPSELCSKNNE